MDRQSGHFSCQYEEVIKIQIWSDTDHFSDLENSPPYPTPDTVGYGVRFGFEHYNCHLILECIFHPFYNGPGQFCEINTWNKSVFRIRIRFMRIRIQPKN
jgi:hypothetical protein